MWLWKNLRKKSQKVIANVGARLNKVKEQKSVEAIGQDLLQWFLYFIQLEEVRFCKVDEAKNFFLVLCKFHEAVSRKKIRALKYSQIFLHYESLREAAWAF